MLAVWAYVEADFRRDYGIRLTEELPHMSWREFKTLLNGLSPYGAVAAHYEEALKEQKARDARTEQGAKEAASRFWQSVASI